MGFLLGARNLPTRLRIEANPRPKTTFAEDVGEEGDRRTNIIENRKSKSILMGNHPVGGGPGGDLETKEQRYSRVSKDNENPKRKSRPGQQDQGRGRTIISVLYSRTGISTRGQQEKKEKGKRTMVILTDFST